MNHTRNCCKLKITPWELFFLGSWVVIFKLPLPSPLCNPLHNHTNLGEGTIFRVARGQGQELLTAIKSEIWGSALQFTALFEPGLGAHFAYRVVNSQQGVKQQHEGKQLSPILAVCQGCLSTPMLFVSARCFSFSWQSCQLNREQLQPRKISITFPSQACLSL